ncbi:MAG: hypothetical protein JXA68_11175 [Ignavibacteriales bacterium]|nr:hypothetical protein [Ignavibacteriales bacterium]
MNKCIIILAIIIALITISCAQNSNNINVSNFYHNLPEQFKESNEEIVDSVVDIENGYLSFFSKNEYGDCHYALKIFKSNTSKVIFGITSDYFLIDCRYYAWLFLEYSDGNLDDAFKKVFKQDYYEYPDSVLFEMGRAYPLLASKLFYDDKETLQILKDYVNYYASDKSVPYDYIFTLPRFGSKIEVTITICDKEFEGNISTKDKFDRIKDDVKTIEFTWNNSTEMFDLEN